MKHFFFSLLILLPSFLYAQQAEHWRVSDISKNLFISPAQDSTYIGKSKKAARRIREREVVFHNTHYRLVSNRKEKQTNWIQGKDTLALVQLTKGGKNRLFTFADGTVLRLRKEKRGEWLLSHEESPLMRIQKQRQKGTISYLFIPEQEHEKLPEVTPLALTYLVEFKARQRRLTFTYVAAGLAGILRAVSALSSSAVTVP